MPSGALRRSWHAKFSGLALAGIVIAVTAKEQVPFLDATCPVGIEVHADEGGPISVTGEEPKLVRVDDESYEARLDPVRCPCAHPA